MIIKCNNRTLQSQTNFRRNFKSEICPVFVTLRGCVKIKLPTSRFFLRYLQTWLLSGSEIINC